MTEINTKPATAPATAPHPMKAAPETSAVRRKGQRRRATRLAGSALIFVALIGAWELVIRAGYVNEIIVPRPSDLGPALTSLLGESFFYEHLWVTSQEVLLGFAIGTVLGAGLGAMLALFKPLRELTYPYVVAFAGLPKVVLAPVFITAFGFGMTSKVVMAITICFFPMLVNTELGLTSVDAESRRLMRSLNASKKDIFLKLSLPHSLPLIFAGMKTALSLALVGAIVGEFVGASAGLGYLLHQYSYQLDVPRVWAITVILAAMGVLLFVAIDQLDKRIVFWTRNAGTTTEV